MTQDTEYLDLFNAISEKSQDLLNKFCSNDTSITNLIKDYTQYCQDYFNIINSIYLHPEALIQMQYNYWQDAMGLIYTQMTQWMNESTAPTQDSRFKSEKWQQNPFFNMLSQQYLLVSEHMSALLAKIDFGNSTEAKRLKFLAQNIIDALSPSNFLHTNPQLIAETFQSNGKNLLLGLQNFLNDIDSESSKLVIKMTDNDAFKIGENIASTPGHVIFRNEMMELIQYSPTTEKTYQIPLLIIPPWINKYYILDLSPSNSLVKYLVNQGITVFILSWVNPDKTYANKGLFSYMNKGVMASIDVIKEQLNVEKVNTLGFCIGGTLQAMTLAYYKATDVMPIHSSTFLASMIDFSDVGDISVYIDEHQIKSIEETMKTKGFLDGKFMSSAFNSLRANDLVWSFFIKNYLQGKTPVPFDILYWNADSTNMPAKMHSQYLRWMYLNNKLIKPGKIKVNHIPLDVHQIDIPTFFLSTKKDHIAPWTTTYIGYQAMKGDKKFVLGGSGHIAGIINPEGSEKYGYWTNKNKHVTSDKWLETAIEHKGSWWPEWLNWLIKQSGKSIDAPTLSNVKYKSLIKAPGRYVLTKN